MNQTLPIALGTLMLGLSTGAHAQRYLTEVFTEAQITVTEDLIYGTNIDFLTSNLGSPLVQQDVVALQTAVATGQPIPPAYFDPADGSTGLKVTNVRFDLYQPDQGVDSEDARPLVIYLHTGNALPPGLNQAPTGSRKDLTVQAICRQLARRGYVASAMSYRLGWNPLAATEEERRAQLLNAIYRALHDVRQHVRVMKADAAGANTYAIDPTRIIVLGEGTGGYISLANATLDRGEELFIEKFRPDPFDPTTSYVDTLAVGGLAGTDGFLNLYKPNGFDFSTQFCVNLGGALADTSWLEPGDVPMVAFHTVFDPFAPFTEGIVIVPTTQGPVVPVQGSNLFMQLVNQFGNNASFATLPDGDPFTDKARSMYGQTYNGVTVNAGNEGLFPVLRPVATAPNQNEASPWQYWDPNSPIATSPSSVPGLTIHQVSLLSNPDMSEAKALTYIDTIMGYMNPRIVCALELGPCSLVNIEENDPIAAGVDLYPNPASDQVFITSSAATIRHYEVFDVNGRLVRTHTVNSDRVIMQRESLKAGVYFVNLVYDQGNLVRRVVLD
jgi:hypothetical protein